MSILTNRHDFLLLFDVTNGNPNGDPDAGNMPRIDPITGRGIVTDVCLKRKVRNFVELFPPERETATDNGFGILVKQGAVIETEQKTAIASAQNEKNPDQLMGATDAEKTKNWLCREFYDVRTFGGVLSTGDDIMKGSAWGQVRGPVQVTFGQSYDPITPLEIAINVCAARKKLKKQNPTEKELADNIIAQTGTQGRKHIVPYALYVAKGYVSPAFAERTGFTQVDLDLLFEALANMFEHDRSAARGEMIVRGIYDFEHVGTQAEANSEQNRKEARLGCAHAHELFEGIKVQLRPGRDFPESFADYKVENSWTEKTLPHGVRLHCHHARE
jgi:CRISPR-associated protein Csd2